MSDRDEAGSVPTPLHVREFHPTGFGSGTPFSWFLEKQTSSALTQTPIDLEIGCGVGLHPILRAKECPRRRLIAIEHTSEKFKKFAGRVAHHTELTNLHPVHADAMNWVCEFVPNESIEHVFLLFPNPEPKASNKRWIRAPFMHELLRKIKIGGTLQLATNEKEYFAETLLYGRDFWRLEIVSERSYQMATLPFSRPRTHFEKKYLERGETCFDVVFRKTHPSVSR